MRRSISEPVRWLAILMAKWGFDRMETIGKIDIHIKAEEQVTKSTNREI